MAWISPAPDASTDFEGLLGHRPELLELYRAFFATTWADGTVDRALLELCRLRIARLHDCEAELSISYPASGLSPSKRDEVDSWETSSLFSPAERASLRLAERMPWNHHEITDDEFAEARELLGEPAAVALVVALALFDARCRLRLAFDLAAPGGEQPIPTRSTPIT